ncbi:cytochrome P450 [Pseudonocardia sp. GCM10023141]|uniref:cytochrome P450 n=1 Tax=Pseudonocardia sp. GCM10023141 TaxID=3252653 RepID=UPI003607B5FD
MTQVQQLPIHMQRNGFDPAPELGMLRERPGIAGVKTPLGLSAWLVTRYADVREVLADAATFASGIRPAGLPGLAPGGNEGSLLASDPPEHTRLRKLLSSEFTVRQVRRLEPRITAIVDEHLDAMEQAGPPADLVASFALPVPSLVICELLGVPYADRAAFQSRAGRQLDISLGIEERMKAGAESRAYMTELVARTRLEPGEDLLGMLVREHGHDLTTGELVGIAGLLLIAGHETTANTLGLGTLALLRNPEQLALMRDRPDLTETAVDEVLRYLSVVHSGMPRVATVDTEIAGQPIAAGDIVVVSLPAANRDTALGDHLEELDLTRAVTRHVAFGHGVHHCIGAPLARTELRIAFPALLRRFPGLALHDPNAEIDFRSYNVVYGVRSLPVTW